MTKNQLYRDILRLLTALAFGGLFILLAPYFGQGLNSPFAALAVESAGVTIIVMGFMQLVIRIAHPYTDAKPLLEMCTPWQHLIIARVFPALVYVVVIWLQTAGVTQ